MSCQRVLTIEVAKSEGGQRLIDEIDGAQGGEVVARDGVRVPTWRALAVAHALGKVDSRQNMTRDELIARYRERGFVAQRSNHISEVLKASMVTVRKAFDGERVRWNSVIHLIGSGVGLDEESQRRVRLADFAESTFSDRGDSADFAYCASEIRLASGKDDRQTRSTAATRRQTDDDGEPYGWGRDERVRATIDHWTRTLEERFRLRAVMPYETERERVEAYIAKAIAGDAEAQNSIMRYMSLFETLGAGVINGGFDLQTVSDLDGARIIEIYDRYQPWIQMRRDETKKTEIYIALELLADRLRALRPT